MSKFFIKMSKDVTSSSNFRHNANRETFLRRQNIGINLNVALNQTMWEIGS